MNNSQHVNERKWGRHIITINFIDITKFYKITRILEVLCKGLFSIIFFLIPPVGIILFNTPQDWIRIIITFTLFWIMGIVLVVASLIPSIYDYSGMGPMEIYEKGFLPPSPIFLDKNKTTRIYLTNKRFFYYSEIKSITFNFKSGSNIKIEFDNIIFTCKNFLIDPISIDYQEIEHILFIFKSPEPRKVDKIANLLIYTTTTINSIHIPIFDVDIMNLKKFLSTLQLFYVNKINNDQQFASGCEPSVSNTNII
jgi:hypothetical protein